MHSQLLKLRDLIRITIPQYEGKIVELQELVDKADVACKDSVAAEQKLTKSAQDERDIAKDKDRICEAALKQATKKRGIGCWLKKIFSFWTSGCH